MIKKFWEASTFKKKLIVAFLPLALIPLICLTVLLSWMYNKQLTKSIDNNVVNTVNLLNEHINTYLDELTRLSVLPYYNSKVLDIMADDQKIKDSDFNQVQQLLSQAIRNPREDLQSVFLYRRDGQIFSSSIYDADINYQYDFKSSLWYKKAVTANGKVIFTGKVNDSRIINRPEPAFSVARAIKLYNGPILGVMIIDVNFTDLENIFKNVNLGNKSNLIVLDDQKNIIYSKNSNYTGALPKINLKSGELQYVKLSGEKLIVKDIDSVNTGWDIVGIASEAEINQGQSIFYKTVLLVSAVIVLAIIIVSILLSSTITKPLKTLRVLMRKVENGDFNVSYQQFSGNMEISLVGRAFNKMNQQIDELINQVLEIRFKQKEAELNNLKLQIRPHFLFNNLEAIRALAEIGDRKGIVEITAALGGMLRYSLYQQDAKVPLRAEVQLIQNYLRIEQIRSGDTLQVEYDLDEEVMDCMTIPILLQPVVENCIHHGFASTNGQRNIRIAIKSFDEELLISIHDNGTGILPDDLEKLNAYLASEADALSFEDFGIGLKNLMSRIRLEYGTSFGVSIFSEYGEGTTVVIKMPKQD